MYGQHFDDAVVPDDPFVHPCEKTVSGQVIHPIHVQLTGHQLVQKFFRIGVFKNLNRQAQCAVKLLVEFGHKQFRKALVVYVDQRIFEGM